MTLNASPARLRDGSWGARVSSETVSLGDTVTITTRSGKSWTARVVRVLWTGDGVAICATESDPPTRSRPRRRPRYVPCGYPGCRPDYCDECDGAGLYG